MGETKSGGKRMKVLFTNDAPLIKYGLAEGFRQTGHTVKIMAGPERLWGQDPAEQEERLSRALNDFKPDFIFTEGHPRIDPKVVGEVARRYSVPNLYWAIEDPVCTDLTLTTYAPEADYIFTTTVECAPRYRTLAKKAEVLLFGCNPEFHRNVGVHPEYRHDIVLVASNYSSRYEAARCLVLPLAAAGFDIRVWGLWWDDPDRPVNLLKYPQVYGGLLPYEALPAVYSSAKIILGLNCDATSITQTSMRPYEALACGGGIYLGHFTKAQARLFPGLIVQTAGRTETLVQVSRILNQSEALRRQLAQNAQIKMYREHTYSHRAQQIIRALSQL
jgi:spore maturation protein CgeB